MKPSIVNRLEELTRRYGRVEITLIEVDPEQLQINVGHGGGRTWTREDLEDRRFEDALDAALADIP